MPDGENWWDSAESIGGEDVAAPGRAVAPPLPAIPEYYQPPAEEPEPIPEWALDSVPISEGFGNLADRHTNNELASDDNEFSGLIAAEIGELRKKEYDLSSRAWRGAQTIPFLGGFLTADSLMDVYHASERYNKGQYWKSDAKIIAAYIAEGERHGDLAWYEKGVEILGNIPGYAVEIYATGGAMSAGRAAVKKTITGIAEKLVKRGALKAFGKRGVARAAAAATRGIGEVGGLAVGGAAMTAVSPWLVAEQTTERAVRNSLAGDDDAFAKALWQGPLSAQIELASEFSGGMALQALGKLPGIRQLKNLVAHKFLKLNRGAQLDDFLKMRDRIGWHGILGELEEERWNEIVNGLTGLSDDYGVIQGIFSNDEGERRGAVEQLGAELLAFSAFGAPFTVANAASYRRGKLTVRKRLEKFVDNQSRGNYSKMHEGTRSLLPLPGQQIEVDGESVKFDPGNKKHREALKPYAERLIQNWDAGIAQTSDEDKAEMVEQVDAFLEAMKGQHTDQAQNGLLDQLEQLRAEENPADAMLREGISLPALRVLRSEEAGVPKRAERFSPQELIEQYSTIAVKLSQASEVTREQFAQWTGAELPEGEEQAILDYQNALNSLFGQLQMEQIEPAAEQVAAVSGEEPAVPTPAAEPAAPTPAAEITEEDLNALRSMTPEEAEGVRDRVAGAKLPWNVGIQGLLEQVIAGEATVEQREELKRLAAANPEWGTVMAGKLNELRAAEPAAEDPAPTAPEAPEAGAGATVVEAAVGTKFMSGMTRSPKRLREALLAGEPVGVSVLSVDRGNLRVISDTILDLISQAAEQGIPVFIDSGAFGLYDNNIEMPWDEVRSEYLRILEAVPPQFRANLYFVAPDVVGDIQGSIDALVANDWVEFELIQQGARVIYPVPMEKGTSFVDSQGAVSSAADIQWDTNSNQRVIGVPFNKAAWSEKDIVEWVREDKEYRDAHPELDVLPEATFPRIHLLGGGLDAVKSLAEKLNEIEPTITVTGDSTRQRARKGRKDTGMDKDATVPIGSAAKAEAVEEEDTWSTYFKGEKGKGRWTAKSEDHARRVEITAEDGQKYVIFFQAEQIAKVHKDLAEKAGGKFGWFIQWGRSDEENENSDGLHGVFFRTQAELKQWARENIDELAVDLEEEVDEPVPEEAEETTFEEQSWADAVAQEAEGMGQAGEAEREYRSMEDDAVDLEEEVDEPVSEAKLLLTDTAIVEKAVELVGDGHGARHVRDLANSKKYTNAEKLAEDAVNFAEAIGVLEGSRTFTPEGLVVPFIGSPIKLTPAQIRLLEDVETPDDMPGLYAQTPEWYEERGYTYSREPAGVAQLPKFNEGHIYPAGAREPSNKIILFSAFNPRAIADFLWAVQSAEGHKQNVKTAVREKIKKELVDSEIAKDAKDVNIDLWKLVQKAEEEMEPPVFARVEDEFDPAEAEVPPAPLPGQLSLFSGEAVDEPPSAPGGVAMAAGAPGEIGPTEPPSTDPAIEPSAREMYPLAFPELVELATGIAEGEIQVKPLSGAAGRFKGQEGQFVIVLNREYARNPLEAAAILGHEIGHLVDYLPDETLARGNVLGRIASFKGTYRKWFINLLERKTETAPRKLRERLRKQAAEEFDTPEEIEKEYRNLLATHGYVSKDDINAELIALSEWWTPYPEDADDAYIAYRREPKELYAQALSVFLNAPKELQNRAPLFWRSFMAFAHTKPEFFSEYQKIQDLLAGDSEELVKHRTRRLADGFLTAEEQILASVAAREAARLSGPEMLMRQLTQGVIDRTAPGKQLAFKAMAKGATTIEAMQMIAMLDELHTMDSPSHALVMQTNREIIEPLNTIAGIADPVLEFGLYVFHRRVIVERPDIFNPLGYNPEESSKAIDDQYQRLNRTFRLPDGTETTQFAYLEEQVTRWHNSIVHPEVIKAFESGLIRPETMKEIGANINNYGAFAVTKFLTDYVDPSIQQQAGTVQEVANPFTATMMKVISMMRVTQINNTKREIVDWMDKYFKEELGEPVAIPHGKTSPARRPSPGKDFMIIVVDGQHIAYEVDEYLVKMFQSHDIGMLQGFSRVLSSAVYRTFHPLFVTFNPSFISGNWIRDIQRTHRNLGAQSRRLEHETIEAELQHIRQTENREPNEAEVAAAQRKGRTMRIGLLDILKARHKLMGWGRVATFLFGKDFKPGPARQFVEGEHVPEIEEAMKEHAYAMSLTDIESQVGGLIPGWLRPEESIREQATRAAQELRDLENPTVFDKFGAKVLPAIGHFLHAFEVVGATTGVTKLLGGIKQYAETQEVAGKMTGYNLLKARGVETRDRAMITRKDVGTPDFMQRGLSSSLTNGIWMYSKVRWNALHSDYQLLKGHLPKTRAAWMMNQLIWTLAPTTFTKLAAYGALGMLPWGDELEDWYKLFSKYFLDNYDVIPLGTTQVDGKRHAVGLTIPRDETRTFVAQMWGNAIDAVIEGTTDIETQAGSVPKGIQELTDALQTNVMPNVNPWLDIMTTYGQYARGMNPRDKFYKGDVIPRSAWEAGGWESNRKLMAWTVKKFGVLNPMVHPITGPILGDAFDDTEENWKQVTVRSTPILQRFLRVSQRGAQDRHWMAMEEERQDTARFRLQLPTTVREANGRQYLLSHTKHLLDDEGMQELLVLNKWRSMTYMPARERMLEATAAGDEQTFNQLREQLSLVTKEVTMDPLANVPDLYLGAIAWQLTNPNFEDPLDSHELKLLQKNGRSIADINRLVKMEALRRNNMDRERTEKRTGRRLRPRTVPKISRALHERLVRARDIFKGKEPRRRRRIGRQGVRG